MASMPTLALNARGEAVATLVSALTAAGYAVPGDPYVFGPIHLAAVQAFQRDHGLPADGIVGAHTWAALGFGSGSVEEVVFQEGEEFETEAPPVAATSSGKYVIPLVLGGLALWVMLS